MNTIHFVTDFEDLIDQWNEFIRNIKLRDCQVFLCGLTGYVI